MSDQAPSNTTNMDEALRASLALLTPTKRPPARPQTPQPLPDPPKTPKPRTPHCPSTPGARTPRNPEPQTLCKPVLPVTPSAPRKRSFFDYHPSSVPTTPPKRTRTSPSTPDSTLSKPLRGRKKKILALDRVVCIPMRVLRAQKDDTSALLRSLPRRSDQLRKLVDLSVKRELEKVRKPGCTGIMDAAVWAGRKGQVVGEKGDAVAGEDARKVGGRKKT